MDDDKENGGSNPIQYKYFHNNNILFIAHVNRKMNSSEKMNAQIKLQDNLER